MYYHNKFQENNKFVIFTTFDFYIYGNQQNIYDNQYSKIIFTLIEKNRKS